MIRMVQKQMYVAKNVTAHYSSGLMLSIKFQSGPCSFNSARDFNRGVNTDCYLITEEHFNYNMSPNTAAGITDYFNSNIARYNRFVFWGASENLLEILGNNPNVFRC